MTSLKGNLSSVDLANIFQMLSMNQREGTLYIFDGQSRKAIYFGRDGVSMLTRGKHKPDALGRILIRCDKITAEQLHEALQSQDESSGRLLGQILVERGIATRADVEDALKTQIEEEVYSLFIWKDAQFEFVEGAPDDEFKGKDGVARLTFNVNSLIMEAAKRVDEWEWIQKVIPTTEEVFRYTGSNVALEDEIFAQAFSGKVLAAVDGKRSVDQIIDVSCVNRFEVTKMLALLLEGGAVEALPVPELRREAQEALAAGDTDQAVKFLTRLVALKGDTPDMHRQLAEVFEGRRQLEKAAFHYKVYAEILADNGERKQAFETYVRICDFLPTDLAASDRMLEIFASNPDGLEQHAAGVIAKGKLLAEVYGELGRQSRAIQVLHRVVALGPEDQDLRQKLIQVYLQSGMQGDAIAEYDALAETALAVRDYDQAEKIYRKILQIDRTREDAQGKLNQLLSKKRMRQRGIRLAIAAAILLGAGGFAGFQAWRWYQEQKQAEVAQASLFGTRFGELRTKHTPLHDELDKLLQSLASAFGEPAGIARVLLEGDAGRKSLLEQANAAAQTYHALAGEFPTVAEVDEARDAAQAVERKVANVGAQLDKLRASLTRTVDDMFERLEPLPSKLPLAEQDKTLKEVLTLAKAVPAWLGSERGARAQAYAGNVSQTLAAFEQMRTDAAALLARNDVTGAQNRIIEFLVGFLPPKDLLEQIQIPRTVTSRPVGAHVFVNDQDTGLVTPCVLELPAPQKAKVSLIKDGFQVVSVDIAGTANVDRNTIQSLLSLTIEQVLHKDLAFRTASQGAKLVGAPAVAGDHLIVPTKGNEAGLFDLSGSARGTFATKGASGVQAKPLLFDDVVAFATYDAMLIAYRISNGELVGRDTIPGKVQADPVRFGELAIVADLDGHVSAFNVRARSVSKAWTYPQSGPGRASFLVAPVVEDGELYAVARDGRICVLDAATGVEKRSEIPREGAAPVQLTTGVAVSGTSLVGVVRADRGQSRIVLIDRQTLAVRSSFTVEGSVRSTPLAWQGFVYVVTDDGVVMSIRLAGESLQAAQSLRLDAGIRVLADPALDEGVLYVGDTLGTLWAIDVRGAQPERLYDFKIPGSDKRPVPITTRPVVCEAFVVFGAGDNAVYGIKK